MRPMVYVSKRCRMMLDADIYKGFEYYILSLGTHPCAYVRIPEWHKFYHKDYDNCYVECHGGMTYASDNLQITDGGDKVKGWFIGWDYAHYGDYMGYYEMFNSEYTGENNHRWTTEEILAEVKGVIEQLSAIE